MKTHLQLDDRLSILRAQDRFRNWRSLDDRRICILCDKTFNGRQIEITRHRHGEFRIHCPTEGCHSKPHQWVYPGNPLVSGRSFNDWWRALTEPDEEVVTAARAS
jgi:hypothetical protein